MGKTYKNDKQYGPKRQKRVRKNLKRLANIREPSKSQNWIIDEADDVLGEDFEKFKFKQKH